MNSKLYVGNLPFSADESQIEAAFAAFGAVSQVQIVRDRETQRPRGFAFVTMATAEEAQSAISGMHGKDLGGRTITVNEARPKEDRPPGGGGGYGGGERRGGGGGGYGGGERRGGGGGGGGYGGGGDRRGGGRDRY
ncbi:MAG: RNA-binding protein [Verrucomicrobiota bacterium]